MDRLFSQRDVKGLIADADRQALELAADHVIPIAVGLAPVLMSRYPNGNVQGPAGSLKSSVGKSPVRLGPYGPYIHVQSDWYAVFPAKAKQVRHKNTFLLDALNSSRGLI